ncbi:hypothetical protein [Pseudoalteromonas pernae]|uniref:hypothetical protein n=1 Tax=Pseudoalteromonas pernae TaxID=3118054 RepID=UPI003242F2F6
MTVRSLKKEQSMTVKYSVTALSALLLFGCQTHMDDGHNDDAHNIVGVDLLNQTNSTLTEVKLQVVGHGGQVSCNHIEAASQCGTGFPVKNYNSEALQLSYRQSNEPISHLFTLKVPQEGGHRYRVSILIKEGKPDVSVIKAMSP